MLTAAPDKKETLQGLVCLLQRQPYQYLILYLIPANSTTCSAKQKQEWENASDGRGTLPAVSPGEHTPAGGLGREHAHSLSLLLLPSTLYGR